MNTRPLSPYFYFPLQKQNALSVTGYSTKGWMDPYCGLDEVDDKIDWTKSKIKWKTIQPVLTEFLYSDSE